MPLNPFLAQFGFDEDPFASTNAAGEGRLADYFVDPPYFTAVLGDPNIPQSHIVLAPRGGGKTAQKRRIENIAPDGEFFCISYDEFDLPARLTLKDVTWDYHVSQICRRLTVGILAFLHEEHSYVQTLDKRKRRLLAFYADAFIGPMSEADFQSALRSIKSIPQRVGQIMGQYGGPVTLFVRAILARLKVTDAPNAAELVGNMTQSQSLRYHLDQLSDIVTALGFRSTYILVDRVDELQLTSNDARKTFEFVRPLLTDLRTLETPHLAFKFFMWDQTEPYVRSGVRLDRIALDVLTWSPAELQLMLSRRLAAYSRGTVSEIDNLSCKVPNIVWDPIVAQLAHGSPREMIVLMRTVIAEQTRTSMSGGCITTRSFWTAVGKFADDQALEAAGKHLDDLKKIGASGRLTFGIAEIASNVFRISQQVTGNKIQNWQRTGVIAQIGTMPNPGKRPPHLYGPVDVRVAIAMMVSLSPEGLLSKHALVCPGCETVILTDRSLDCPRCHHPIRHGETESLVRAAHRR